MILETPKDEIDSDRKNMEKIKEIYFSGDKRALKKARLPESS